MKRTIRNLLQYADQKSIEEMASLSHMTDDATKERIFREVQKRAAPANHFAPAETETYHAKPDHSIDWSSLVSAAAACVMIVGTTAGCLYLMQHKPNPIQPGMSVEQSLESETPTVTVESTEDRQLPAITLTEANEQETPWKGHIIQMQRFAGLTLERAFRSEPSFASPTETYETLTLMYRDPTSEVERGVTIEYTLAPAERFLQGMQLSDLVGYDTTILSVYEQWCDEDHAAFLVNYGDYRIYLSEVRMTKLELRELLNCIWAGIEAKAPVILTLDEANAMEMPWQGKVLQTQQISNMPLEEVYTGQLTYQEDGNTYDELYLHYKDSTVKGYHDMTLTYLEKTEDTEKLYPDSQSPDMLADAKIGMPYQSGRGCIFHQSGDTSFTVEFGDYFVIVRGRGCTVDEVREIADLLQAQGQDEPETAQLTDTGEEEDAQE